MPIWTIAWRSIQRRALASLLTTLSMALGVMLVVAVLLTVGVVDESFRSNSSLGYDTIVGPKGGQLQLTLNTVYYLSRPVNNLPFEFYRQFLPKEARSDLIAIAGKEYENKVEVQGDEQWLDTGGIAEIPGGETSLILRVPLLGETIDRPKEFTFVAEVESDNTVNKKAEAVAVIQPGKTKLLSVQVEAETSGEKDEDNSEADQDPETTANVADAESTDAESTNNEAESNMTVGPPELKVMALPAASDAPHVYFEVTLNRKIEAPVTFAIRLTDGADGAYFQYVEDSKTAVIPVCLGDYYDQYRVVGTTAEFFELVYDRERNLSYQFADGQNFTPPGDEILFEAIVGAKVARDLGIKVGDAIKPAHGAPGGKTHDDFKVVGILASSGTPQDRAVFVNMDGFNEIPDHKREDGKKEVTALLVDTKGPFRSMQLQDRLSDEPIGEVVKPVAIIFNLFNSIVGPIRNLLLAITALICVVSGISILVSIYNSMNDRKHEIAIMRSLGAGRGLVMCVVLLESVMISLAGGILGWIAGHALIGVASHTIEAETGVVVSAFQFAPPMEELSYLLGTALTPNISVEFWLIPMLIILAIIVGFMPALSAYRTDVAKALQSSP